MRWCVAVHSVPGANVNSPSPPIEPKVSPAACARQGGPPTGYSIGFDSATLSGIAQANGRLA
jgi:hypothetical protein